MALLLKAMACGSLLLPASDAFRSRVKRRIPSNAGDHPHPGPPPAEGDEPITDRPCNDSDWTKYDNRPRIRSAECPKPTGKPGNVGDVGHVDWLYTFAAPGPGSPGLKHATNEDGVFPGLRTWQVTGNGWVDLVPLVTVLADMWHPWMNGEEIAEGEAPLGHPVGQDMTHWPYTIWGAVSLHPQGGYRSVMQEYENCPEWQTYSGWPLTLSYYGRNDLGHAINYTRERGWNLVGYGVYDGENGHIGGEQESYLIQNPDTLECVLTFQGTRHFNDWVANLAFSPGHFCGYTEEDEWCVVHGGFCSPRKERGSFVHMGFAQHLRNMVRGESWQQGVRAKLGKCAAVYVTGHSLGGAAASLFTGCISQQLQEGQYGYEDDYKYMAWTQAQPERMEAIVG